MEGQKYRDAWLNARPVAWDELPRSVSRVWRLVLLGAPGVGKGTQAALLEKSLGAAHFSTGDVFRTARSTPSQERTPAMKDAIVFMDRGLLVPDATVLQVVRERAHCLNFPQGFLLDGFPRTVVQAQAFEQILLERDVTLDAVLNYELPLAEIVTRPAGRRTCRHCKAVFHLEARPTRVPDVCDRCGGPLKQRPDDEPEAVCVRFAAYEKSTRPLEEFYRQRGLLIGIDAHGTPEEICEKTLPLLQESVQ